MSQEQSQIEQPSSPLSSFTINRAICSGRNPVYQAYDNKLNRHVVLKTFSYISKLHEGYIREKAHLMSLDHPHIVQLYEAVDLTTSTLRTIEEEVSYLSLEYASYGDVLEIISERGQLPEILARTLFHQFIEAVSYLHRRNIAHMDLKVENILIDSNFNLKLIDFDLSQSLDSLSSLKSNGTPGYRAPELKKDSCTDLQAADIYSAAVILFIMITGYPPYSEVRRGYDNQYDAYYRLLRSDVGRFWEIHAKHKKDPKFYSDSFKSLVTRMLAEEAADRPTIADIKDSQWFQGPILTGEEFKDEMRRYLQVNQLC